MINKINNVKLVLYVAIIGILTIAIGCNNYTFYSLTGDHTRVVFNQEVDLRYAWLGNDAEVINYQNQIIDIINNSNTSIEVSSMTFSIDAIADALANKADAGVQVRIIGNSAHRIQHNNSTGYMRALRGNMQIIDNNHPALIHKINFQKDAGAPPSGWLADRGETFGVHDSGISYGWQNDENSNIKTANEYLNPLLDDCFAAPNSSGVHNWEIQVPNGVYYVAVACGQPGFNSKSFVQAEGQNIFNGGAFERVDCGIGEFKGSIVDGGQDLDFPDEPTPNSMRITVNDNRLTLSIGKLGETSFSSICFVEIYRGDEDIFGDDTYDDGLDNTIQDKQTVHAKYIIADAGTANEVLWCSSGNLTQAMESLSEDAIISTDPQLIAAFLNQFNQQWGAISGVPVVANSNFGTYKSITPGDFSIDGFDWKARFSPSKGVVDISDNINSLIQTPGSNNLILIMEQFTTSGGQRGFAGPSKLVSSIQSKLGNAAYKLHALISSEAGVGNAQFSGSNVQLGFSTGVGDLRIHNKYALVDALRDSRYSLKGKLWCGSMNWSQSAMVYSDEHSLLIENPYIANAYLQHAMMRLEEKGLEPPVETDIILVMDRSGSMNQPSAVAGLSKLEASQNAAKLFLDILQTDNSHRVSVVKFGEITEVFAPPIALIDYNANVRTNYKNAIDGITADGPIANHTCYGAALKSCMTQFDDAVPSNPRRIIHLFTDGKENFAPYSNALFEDLNDKNIEVHSTGLGGATDMAVSLENLATETAGTYAQVTLDPIEINKRFAEVARNAMDQATVLDPDYLLKAGQFVKEHVFLDKENGKAEFILMWDNITKNNPEITIISPEGKEFKNDSPGIEFIKSKGYTVIHLDPKKAGINARGEWTLVINASRDNEITRASLMVLADSDIHFSAEAELSSNNDRTHLIMARMLYKIKPVNNLRIVAEIRPPVFKENELPRRNSIVLKDEGGKYDKSATDGLYSVIFRAKSPLNHNVHLIAKGTIQVEDQTYEIRREFNLSTRLAKGSKK